MSVAKMKAFRVQGGVARIGMGEVVGLDADQFRHRQHRVEAIDTKGEVKIVRLMEPLEFKEGETVLLPGEPPKNVAALVVAAEPERPSGSDGRPKKEAAPQ